MSCEDDLLVLDSSVVLLGGICLNIDNPNMYLLYVCCIHFYSFQLLVEFFYVVTVNFLKHCLRLIRVD
jgi:hypothetical protein